MIPRIGSAAGDAAGFTLIELLIGLAVMSAVALLGLPMTRNALGDRALETAASDFASAARLTRATAMRAGAEKHLSLDPSNRQYWAEGVINRRILEPHVSLAVSVPERERSGDSADQIRFLPSGAASGAEVTFSSGSRTIRVRIDWFSGAVHVSP